MDRISHRAAVEAGYASLAEYIEKWGEDIDPTAGHADIKTLQYIVDLQAEIERLRKVLEHVSCMCLGQCVHGVKDRENCIRYTARSALQQKESE